MPTAEKTTPVNQETWLDWLRYTQDPLTREEFIEGVNQEYGSNLSAEQLQSWEDRGLLPLPIQGIGYPRNAWLIVGALQDFERDANDIPPESVRALLRGVARRIDRTAYLDVRDRLVEIQQEAEASRQTWVDWMPPDWLGPADEELITRDELLTRAKGLGVDIHPRTLQIMESQGLVPRPIRRWHDGAVRALYAPWVVDLALRAYERRRGRWPLDKAIEDVRGAVKEAIFTHQTITDHLVSHELLTYIRTLADQHATRTGTPIQSSEIRLLDADGQAVATLRQRISR